jgi:probable HAF family extracellular repeat protein
MQERPSPRRLTLVVHRALILRFRFGKIILSFMKLGLAAPSTHFVLLASLVVSGLYADSYTIAPIQYPGAVQTTVSGINDQGQTVGIWATDNFAQVGSFIYNSGAFTSIPVGPVGINDSDQILTQIGNIGYIYQGGNYTQINYPGSTSTFVSAISNNGYVTGVWNDASNAQNAFLYENGSYILFPLTTYLVPQAVNDQGIIVGSDEISEKGFIRNANGSIKELAYPGSSYTGFYSINDSGEILGQFSMFGVPGTTPFLYSNGMFTPLPELSDDILTGFNNKGQIVGWITPAESFVATPTAEPATAVLLGLSLTIGAFALRLKSR